MSKKITKLLSFLLLFSMAVSTQITAQNKLDKKTLIRIDGEKVSVKDFMDVFTKNNTQPELIDKKSIDEYLDLYINFRLKVLEAKTLRMDTISSFVNELDGYRKQLAKPYFTDETVSEALLQEAYQHKLQDIRASHILLMLDKNAMPEDTLKVWNRMMAIRERAIAGEDFSALAVEFSEDPSAQDREAIPGQRNFRPGNKGDLGYFSVFDMVYPFEKAAYTTEVGRISMPVRSDFGYHLIKVDERSQASGTIEAAHVYVSLTPDATEEAIAEKEEKIQFIYQKILDGMRFEEAVEEYSEDRGSAQREGRLSKFTVNRIVPEFVSVVKKMQAGEVSAPVRTMYGFHIIKLIGMERPGTLEEETPKLKERLAKDMRAQKSEQAVIEQIKKENKFHSFDENLQTFIAQLDTSLINAEFDPTPFENNKKSLFSLAKQNYTVADFAQYIAEKQIVQEDISPTAYANKLFNDFLEQSCIEYEDARLEQKHPDFAALMNEYRDGILLFDLMDKQVWTKAVKDTLGLQEFHKTHSENYLWGERAVASIYTITKPDRKEQIIEMLRTISDDDELRIAMEKDSLKNLRIQQGKFERGTNKYVDAVNWELGLSDEIKAEADKQSIYVRIHELLPPQAKLLEEARGIITSDYQNELERQWVAQLREKYPVKVNRKVLDELQSRYQ